MMMFQYSHTEDADDGDLVFLYSHTEDGDDDTYDRIDDAFSIQILEIQMMIVQYSHTEDVDDDGSEDDVTR